jgi:hypothetical protein
MVKGRPFPKIGSGFYMNRRDRSGIPSERQHMTCVRIFSEWRKGGHHGDRWAHDEGPDRGCVTSYGVTGKGSTTFDVCVVEVCCRSSAEGRGGKRLETGFQIRDNSVRRCPEIEFGAPGVTEKIQRKGEKECRPIIQRKGTRWIVGRESHHKRIRPSVCRRHERQSTGVRGRVEGKR